MGEMIVGWVGASLLGMSTTAIASSAIATVISGAITGAIVGAAIGGISTAITGGDIGQGMLTGAIGGAVLGGLTSAYGVWDAGSALQYNANAGNFGMTTNAAGEPLKAVATAPEMSVTGQTVDAQGNIISKTMKPADTGFMSSETADIAGQTISGAAQGYLGQTDGPDLGDQMALQQAAIDAQSEEGILNRESSLTQLEMQLASNLAQSEAGIDEQRRQFDVGSATALARSRDAGKTRGVLTVGEGTGTGAAPTQDLGYDFFDPKNIPERLA